MKDPVAGPGSVAIRPARIEDRASITSLFAAADWPVPSERRWRWLFEENPAIRSADPGTPIGWVLEGPEGIGGYLGNIACQYSFKSQSLTGMIAHALFVSPAWRASALLLPAAFFGQKSVPLLLTTTANPASAAIYRAFKADFLPDADYAVPLSWIASPGRVVGSLLQRRMRLPPALFEPMSRFSNLLARPVLGLMRHGPARPKGAEPDLAILPVEMAGAQVDALWERVREAEQRLLPYRDAATLRWHFGDPDSRCRAALVTCSVNRRLDGYLVLVPEYAPDARLAKAVIADLLTDPEAAPVTVDWLLWAAHSHARRLGFDVIELRGFPPSVRNRFAGRRAMRRPMPSMPYLYKANDDGLAAALAAPEAWFACPYDGDASLTETIAAAPPGNPPWFARGLVADS